VAITGTNGKTSTKEMVAAALRTRYRTHATRANLNNLVGVPQTILEAPEDTEALVLEAGANVPGEIPRCREIIEPDVAIVTNAAAGHLEGFGGVEGVVAEKLALTRDVGVALVGLIPPALAEGARSRGARRVLTVGLAGADVVPDTVEVLDDGCPRLRVSGRTLTLSVLGRHQAANAMFAWATAQVLGLDLDAVAGALERVTLPAGRGEVLTRGRLTIINDSYNANPASFEALIATARQLRGARRLVFVAGTMLELGAEEGRWHRAVAERLLELDPDLLAVVGRFVPEMEALGRHPGDRLVTAPDALTLGPLLAARLRGDELVILKASRGVALERIIPAITTHPA
jgi:UDP-N-acetylmuramoyl-tripeptide--D-alanyl-D-alanine ligase